MNKKLLKIKRALQSPEAAHVASRVAIPAGLLLFAAIFDEETGSFEPPIYNYQYFPARIASGARPESALRWIVIHSTEGDTAAGAASWFQNPAAGGSTQLVVGEDGLYRSLDDLVRPAGAPGANDEGLHIEFAGYAKWPRETWLARKKTLEDGSKAIAEWGRKYKIPLKMLTIEQLRDPTSRGVTTHAMVSQAFKKSDHWDPGTGFPFDVVLSTAMAMV